MRSMPPPAEVLHVAGAEPALASSRPASGVLIGDEPADDGNRPGAVRQNRAYSTTTIDPHA